MDREAYIWTELTNHYLEAFRSGHEIFGIFLQGSQNYGLDVYTEDYRSDIDTKAIVIPSLDDIIQMRKPVSTTHVRANNEHIDLKDIRLMFDCFKKQNINFIEILFTEFYIINPLYEDLWEELRNNAEQIARAHLNQTLRCVRGMAYEKQKALCHPYPATADKIEKYGYDPKQLHHIVRMFDFLYNFLNGVPYQDCIKVEQGSLTEFYKFNIVPLEKAIEVAEKYCSEIDAAVDTFKTEQEVINREAYATLDKIKSEVIKRSIINNLGRN